MSTLERLERANPVADADRLLSAPAAMDDFLLAVQERSGIVHTTEDRPPIEVPTETKTEPPRRDWRRRLVPALAAAAAIVAAIVVAIVLLGGDDETLPDVGNGPESTPVTTATTVPEIPAVVPYTGQTLQGDGVLTVGAFVFDLLPLIGSEGESGFEGELIAEIAARLGLTVTIDLTGSSDFDVLLGETGDRYDVFVSSAWITSDGGEIVSFTDPYYRVFNAMVVNTELTPEITGVADLGGGDIVWSFAGSDPTDPFSAGLAAAGVEFIRSADPFGAIRDGLATAFFNDVALMDLDEVAGEFPTLEVIEVVDAGLELGIAVDPNNQKLLEALNSALRAMVADGTYQEIYDRWFDHPEGSVAP